MAASSNQMSPEEALKLYETGAFLIIPDFPEGSEFGVDYKSWTTGPKFEGLKMIPPGVHFIYYSLVSNDSSSKRQKQTDSASSSSTRRGGERKAPRIGFFHCFKPREVMIRKWDEQLEDLSWEPPSEEESLRFETRLRELDGSLGAYPFENYRTWFSLSNHITADVVEMLRPERGRISAQAELITLEAATLGEGHSRVDRAHPERVRYVDEQGLPIMNIRNGYQIRFHTVPDLEASSASERSNRALDWTDRLDRLLTKYADEQQMLAEIQFAFLCFLLGHVYDGFEQWKRLIRLLCCCRRAPEKRPKLYSDFLMVLHFQLKECPLDFFVDIVTRDNFLTTTLTDLFVNISDIPIGSSGVAKGDDKTHDDDCKALQLKARKFKLFLTKKFKWNFDPAPDAPLVV